MPSERQFLGNIIIDLVSEVLRRMSKQSFFRAARSRLFSSYKQREIPHLEALSPEAAKSHLETMGLDQHWVFTDFDEVVIEQSSQHLWAKTIIQQKKVVVPRVVLKYVRHFKWKENLFESNQLLMVQGTKQTKGLKNRDTPIKLLLSAGPTNPGTQE